MRYVLFILLLSVGTLTNCGNGTHADKLRRIDSLAVKLDTVIREISNMESEALLKAKSKIEYQMEFIQRNFPDTVTPYLANQLSDYKMNRKLMKTLLERKSGLKKEAEYSLEQLQNLRSDLKNDLLSEEEVREYYRDEFEAAETAIKRFYFIREKYPFALERYEQQKVTADSVISELNRRGIR